MLTKSKIEIRIFYYEDLYVIRFLVIHTSVVISLKTKKQNKQMKQNKRVFVGLCSMDQ